MASVKLKLPPPPCGPATMNRFGKPWLCRPRNVLRSFGFPLALQRLAAATGDHVERRRRHPLKAGRIDQHVERVFDAVVHHAVLVDPAHAVRRGIDEVHVRQVEARQVFVVERRALAAVRVVGLQRGRGFRIFDDRVYPRADLFHDAEVGVELLLEQFLGAEHAFVLLALLEIGHAARQGSRRSPEWRCARRISSRNALVARAPNPAR